MSEDVHLNGGSNWSRVSHLPLIKQENAPQLAWELRWDKQKSLAVQGESILKSCFITLLAFLAMRSSMPSHASSWVPEIYRCISGFKTSLHPGELIYFGGLLSVISNWTAPDILQPFSNSISSPASQRLIWETQSVFICHNFYFLPSSPHHPFSPSFLHSRTWHIPENPCMYLQLRTEHWLGIQFYFVYSIL